MKKYIEENEINVMVVPKGLSSNIVTSQMLPILNTLNASNNNTVLAVHISDKIHYAHVNEVFEYENIYNIKNIKKINYIYTRSVFDFFKLYIVKKILRKNYKILFDFRAIVSEESSLRNNSKAKKILLSQLEKFAYRKADKIHAVSYTMENYLSLKFGRKEIKVIPCCTDINYLKHSNPKDKIKFVYVGGISEWQKFDTILNTYKKMQEQLKNTTFTVITLEVEKARHLLQKNSLDDVEVKSLPQREVIDELKKYDFGFLLRDDIVLNNVASPIKFVEYIAQGVIPILSKGVGDYSELVEKHKIGIVVDFKDNELKIQELNQLLKDPLITNKLYDISENFLWKNFIDNDFFGSF